MIKENKNFKFTKETQSKPQDVVTDINSILGNYNTDIRTNKNIKILGNGRLKIPVFATDPTLCEVGEIAFIGGVTKICSTTNTWTAI